MKATKVALNGTGLGELRIIALRLPELLLIFI
jgi:hypothetical protein